MKFSGHVAGVGDTRSVSRVLVGNSERKRPLGNSRIDKTIILKLAVRVQII
jgi:hypothetical protein